MTDPLEFLVAAHGRAEEIARALRDDLWWPPEAERIEVYTDSNILIAGADDTIRCLTAAADPAAVLRRIAAERELLALHQPEREAYIYPDVDGPEPGVLTVACKTCAQGQHYDLRPEVFPCPTVRLLAEAWGWTEQEEQR
ncbi:DUF6221 family protein [Streptantibioticus rubrisoli]|uniref:DUF6221 family protein n=1 Tax=Streptantibioticus rubrisoli TaxID=1387313 RepID=A0ABT1P5H0_9ACTN|nr:DUF6221 family protein [Streptantibioticus rubrisoli]MCQ4040611.1 DUF6221 family protein [Streptantibioticus rubrisoli]